MLGRNFLMGSLVGQVTSRRQRFLSLDSELVEPHGSARLRKHRPQADKDER
jgi:hypothetical protein